jgi:hypothetical protein
MKELELEVFRAGDYGEKGSYDIADLDNIIRDYDPGMHEAPVTIDHARSGPAYGWVKGLKRVGNKLVATLKGVSEDFFRWVKDGAYKKRSIELYRKFTSTGRPYLRALTFLGAAPPEVKGLADIVFGDDGIFDQLDSDEVNSPPENSTPIEKAKDEFSKITDPGKVELETALRERDELRFDLKNIIKEKLRTEAEIFCERLKMEGRILPAWEKNGLVEFILSLDEKDEVSFGESSKMSPRTWFCSFLENLPSQVKMEEVVPEKSFQESLRKNVPLPVEGREISPESIETHVRVLEFLEKNPESSYTEALLKCDV